MLKNAQVSGVIYDQEAQCCTIQMQNGDTFYGEDLADRQQLEEYIRMLQTEDGLIVPDPNTWKFKGNKAKQLLRIQCFGTFEAFYQEVPMHFERKGAKEIFAFLIDKRGASVSRVEICSAIWEDASTIDRRKSYFRTLILSLRNTLKNYNLEDVFISHRDDFAINTSLMDCDYYRFLSGEEDKSIQFRGAYMSQYSWAENTLGQLIEETGFHY